MYPRVAAAVGLKAQKEGVAKMPRTREQLLIEATRAIRHAQEMTRVLMREGSIPPPPLL